MRVLITKEGVTVQSIEGQLTRGCEYNLTDKEAAALVKGKKAANLDVRGRRTATAPEAEAS